MKQFMFFAKRFQGGAKFLRSCSPFFSLLCTYFLGSWTPFCFSFFILTPAAWRSLSSKNAIQKRCEKNDRDGTMWRHTFCFWRIVRIFMHFKRHIYEDCIYSRSKTKLVKTSEHWKKNDPSIIMSPHSGQLWLLGTVTHYKKWWFWHARRTLRTEELVAGLLQQLGMVVVVNRKQEVRYRLMPIKKRRNASTRRDGWWFLAILWQTQAPADSSELYGARELFDRLGIHPKSIFHARKTIWTSLANLLYPSLSSLYYLAHSLNS